MKRQPAVVCAIAIALSAGCGGGWSGGIHARMAFSHTEGLRVVDVPRDGPAWNAGLREGDRIVAIDGEAVAGKTEQDVVRLLRGQVGTNVDLEVTREGETRFVTVERAPYEPASP